MEIIVTLKFVGNKIRIFHNQIPLFMRFSILFFFLSIGMLCAENITAQVSEISLRINNQPMEVVLEEIEKQTDYSFIYDHRNVNAQKVVTVSADNKDIFDVLNQLFAGTDIEYKLINNKIILSNDFEPSAPVTQQQKKTVTGTVTDASGETLIGVNVMIKGTNRGFITNYEGVYTITDAPDNGVLVFSYVGYLTQEVAIGSASHIIMQEDSQSLDEVVIIGYGTAKKRDLTGAISSIKAENLAAQAPRNVYDILRANAAGLNIGLATDAKAEASLAIRGQGTLSASSTPLIVLDGVIYEGALADINPQDIATVDVLKDASSAAVYGAKAANGVIVFTTKKGKVGKPIISATANIGIAQSASQPKILDAEGFLKFRQDYNEGRNSESYLEQYPQIFVNPYELNGVSQLDWYNYDQATPVTSVSDQQLMTQWLSRLNFTIPELENYFANNITRWDDLVFQNAFQQDYTVSVSNTTDHTSQYISLGWTDREGIITGDRFQIFRARANLESKVTSFLTVGMNANYAYRDESALKASWNQMTMNSPYASDRSRDTESIYQRNPTGLDPVNPFYDNLYTDRKDVKHTINAKVYGQVKLPLGIEYTMNFTPFYSFDNYFNHHSSKAINWVTRGGQSTRTHSKQFNWQIDNIINWKREFANQHKVEVTLLANAEKAQYWQTSLTATDYSPNDVLGYHRVQAASVTTLTSNDTYQTGDALMARLFYSYQNKYMITTSVRRDGFSAFGKKNPHAVFPAVALGWVFTQERFMESMGDWLNYGKLRFSWGENGNREIGRYAALSQMGSGLLPYIDQSGNVYTTSQIYVSTMPNYNLKWERTASYNVGIDFSLFGDLLSGSIEGYTSRTNDLLVNRALPNITGFSSVTANLGQVQNHGFELTLNAIVMDKGDFKWNASANLSFNRRKINKLYGDMEDILDANGNVIGQKESNDETNGWFIGQDPDRIWSYERDGVWQLNEKDAAAVYGCQPGDFKYMDQNGDGIMDNKDKVFQGYKTPRFRWTLRNEFTFRDFTASVMLYSYWKYYGAHQRAANNYSFPDRTSDYDFPRWTSTNPINDYARIGSKNLGTNWVEKSFIRVENIAVSYNVPKKLLQQFSVQSMRLSLTMQNPLVWAPHWDFWDPEAGGPTPRSFTLGVNVTL